MVEERLSYNSCILLQSMSPLTRMQNMKSKIIVQPKLCWITSSSIKTYAFDLPNFNPSSLNFLSGRQDDPLRLVLSGGRD